MPRETINNQANNRGARHRPRTTSAHSPAREPATINCLTASTPKVLSSTSLPASTSFQKAPAIFLSSKITMVSQISRDLPLSPKHAARLPRSTKQGQSATKNPPAVSAAVRRVSSQTERGETKREAQTAISQFYDFQQHFPLLLSSNNSSVSYATLFLSILEDPKKTR